jgi:hypothetical protein
MVDKLLLAEILIHSATAWLLIVVSNTIRIVLEKICFRLYIVNIYPGL